MEFTSHDLRHLRYRMNWTQAEMARVLGCELESLTAWERGDQPCEFSARERGQLLVFQSQADVNSGQVQRRAMADGLMAARGLSQMLDGEVVDCLSQSELATFSFR